MSSLRIYLVIQLQMNISTQNQGWLIVNSLINNLTPNKFPKNINLSLDSNEACGIVIEQRKTLQMSYNQSDTFHKGISCMIGEFISLVGMLFRGGPFWDEK